LLWRRERTKAEKDAALAEALASKELEAAQSKAEADLLHQELAELKARQAGAGGEDKKEAPR